MKNLFKILSGLALVSGTSLLVWVVVDIITTGPLAVDELVKLTISGILLVAHASLAARTAGSIQEA